MADDNQTLLTVVIIVIAALIVLWLLWRIVDGNGGSNCYGPKPDPVGGIVSESLGAGQVKISWDHAPNADHYRVFINAPEPVPVTAGKGGSRRFNLKNKSPHPVGACGDASCCPQEACDTCVSQSNYAKVVETRENYIIVETCEPEICYIVVPYNRCNQAGSCKSVYTASVECIVDDIEAYVVQNDCRGLEVRWNCPKCCDTVNIYVDGALVDSVDAAAGVYSSAGIDCCAELALQCESSCGQGQLNVILAACPTGTLERPASDLVNSRRKASAVRAKKTVDRGVKVHSFKGRK